MLCDEVCAIAAQEIFPRLSHTEALELAERSYRVFHDCYGAIAEYATQIGEDPIATRQRMFTHYHALLFELLEQRHPNFFDHTSGTSDVLARTSSGLFENAILSHSCMEGWGIPALTKMGILEHFKPHLVWGMDNYAFERKYENSNPMKRMIEASGYPPERIIFIEDSWKNTRPAFEDFGIKVALIHYDRPAPSPHPEGVRWISSTPADLMETLEREFALSDLSNASNLGKHTPKG